MSKGHRANGMKTICTAVCVSGLSVAGLRGKAFAQVPPAATTELPHSTPTIYPAITTTGSKALLENSLDKPVIFAAEVNTRSSFGLEEAKGSFVVNTGAHTVFTISRTNGDMTSIKYNGRELEAPIEKANRYSHYASGLSKSSKITAEQDPAGQWIKITCEDEGLGVTQYYVARRGFDNIYMATYAAQLPSPGEMRYITYLNLDVFTHVPASSNIGLSDTTIEGKDVFKNSKTGTTYSKFFGSSHIIDGPVHGITGEGVGAFMNMGNRETSSHGPFFRDIENQSTQSAAEFYNYMYSGHTPTEPFRPGLHGPYALQFTDGRPPMALDYGFLADVGLQGYIPAAGRGTVKGKIAGVPREDRPVVALSNATAQYWDAVDASGNFSIAGVIPGTYTQTLFDGELAVAKKSVTVEAASTIASNIDRELLLPPAAVFRIGKWDGMPKGFLNFEKIGNHHPSDACMTPFTKGNFVVGRSKDEQWPLAEFKDVNNDQKITFDLTAKQATTPMTLRIGITLAYAEGRPQIEVNAGKPNAWASPLPEASVQPKQSRGITRGTWRGNNFTFSFEIPPAALHAGSNTIDIAVGGGISKPFPGFLSPSIVFDAIDLVPSSEMAKSITPVANNGN